MLPNFLIIGAQKSATTWLVSCLAEHPDVFMYMRETPEIHFFDTHFEKGLNWYEAHFKNCGNYAAIGEKTPEYLSDPAVPSRIVTTLGEVKLIVCLRDPVSRAYSAFSHYMRTGRIPVHSDFATCLKQDLYGLRSMGAYFTHLRHYLNYFPREKLLVLVYENLVKDPQRAITDCLEFLELDSCFVPKALNTRENISRDMTVLSGPIWGSWRALKSLPYSLHKPIVEPLVALGRRVYELLPQWRPYTPLPEYLHQDLLASFMPEIEQLEMLLNRDLSVWRTRSYIE